MAYQNNFYKFVFLAVIVAGSAFAAPAMAFRLSFSEAVQLDGGNSPGTYEPDPDDRRRGDDHGGPYNEPGSDNDRGRGGDEHGGPYNEPGSDSGPYYSRPKN